MKAAVFLLDELEQADMLEIDGLFGPFELNDAVLDEADLAAEKGQTFTSDAVTLTVHCMDGRTAKTWRFTYNALMEAEHQTTQWHVEDIDGQPHRMRCLTAVTAEGDGE